MMENRGRARVTMFLALVALVGRRAGEGRTCQSQREPIQGKAPHRHPERHHKEFGQGPR
jgi:hypothetical protein